MKNFSKYRLTALLCAFILILHSAAYANPDPQRSDLAIVMRTLMSFANTKEYDVKGEMTIHTKTNLLGNISEETQTVPVTGSFADGVILFDNFYTDDETSVTNPLSGLVRGIERSMLDNLIVIDDFATGGARYLDILVLDFSEEDAARDSLSAFLTEGLSSGEDEGLSTALREILAPLLGSLTVEGTEFFRIDTKARRVVGIGLNVTMGAEFDLVDTPISIFAEADAYIEIVYP